MRTQTQEVKLDRTKTNFKELLDIIDTVGGYPVMATDFDGTKLAINYKEESGVPCCSVFEPGHNGSGTVITSYYEDGRKEQSVKKR